MLFLRVELIFVWHTIQQRMTYIDRRPQLSTDLLVQVSPKLLSTSAQVSNSAFETVEEYYASQQTPRPVMSEAGLKASYFGSQAHQMMMFYFLLQEKNDYAHENAKELNDFRSTYITEPNFTLIRDILESLHPLSSHLSVRDQTVLAMKCWMTMQDFSTKKVDHRLLAEEERALLPEAKRVELWLDQGNRDKLTSILDTIDDLAQTAPKRLPRSVLLESPHIVSYFDGDSGIQSWIQPDRLQWANGKIIVFDYKFSQASMYKHEWTIADWIQIASLSIVGRLRSSFLSKQEYSKVLSKPGMYSLPIENLPEFIRGVTVVYENPLRRNHNSIERVDVTLSDEKTVAVVESLKKIASDFRHPDMRSGFRAYLKQRTYASKLLSPTPVHGSLEDNVEEIARLNLLYQAYR